ncbi:MAG: alcohol dehydrogenase catalytic domain-containing protein [Actinomycetota bacterium]|nr:alcohol dehydrogenase catalytic domain-containing protein [Actinomycetota bacterium]
MRAAVFAGVGRLEIEERPEPGVGGEDEVLLEVEACGVCGTDLKILADPPGHPATVGVVLGHEFVGRAEGRRFVVAPNIACGRCEQCRRGLRNQCERFTTLGVFRDGGLAPLVRVPAANCHPISPGVPAEIAALAEPLSTVVHGVRQLRPFPGERALVIGAGPIGLMFVALLRHAGCRVGVVEPSADRRALAERLGAEEVGPAELVVDAVGSQLPAALERVERGGRILLFGVDSRARAEIAQERITRDELTIIGSFVGQDVFPAAVSLLESGLDLAPLVSHRIGLDELPAALDDLRAGRAVKVEVVF